ncbi:hypothetical protein YC2023_089504 [Brassica napus]
MDDFNNMYNRGLLFYDDVVTVSSEKLSWLVIGMSWSRGSEYMKMFMLHAKKTHVQTLAAASERKKERFLISPLRHPASLVGAVRGPSDAFVGLNRSGSSFWCAGVNSSIGFVEALLRHVSVDPCFRHSISLLFRLLQWLKRFYAALYSSFGMGPIPASLNLLDDGFSLINYKGRIGLALGGATVLSLFLDPYGATLVSSQAPTVDNRRTKLLETSHCYQRYAGSLLPILSGDLGPHWLVIHYPNRGCQWSLHDWLTQLPRWLTSF